MDNGESRTSENRVDIKKLKKQITIRLLSVIIILILLFFLTSGTINYWEAWIYMAILFIPMIIFLLYMIKRDPEMLERRLKIKEKEKEQRLIVKFSFPFFVSGFLLPGFDKRFGWSSVPFEVIILADVIVLLGYAFFIYVLTENRYASRVVEVEQKQKIITTGPYKIVRHPMYLSIVILYIFTPLALASFWALIPFILFCSIFIFRIINEEKVLVKELEGYADYIKTRKYRLIPGIW